jgi:exonuclease III
MIRKALIAATAGVLVVTASLSAQNRPQERPARVNTAVEPGPGAQIPKPAGKNAIRIMTYNVENWNHTFLPRAVLATTQPGLPDNVVEVLKNSRTKADEENWEVARTIIDVQPDIWVMQEGCKAEDLNYFNTQFLGGYFETVHIFKTNTERDQNTGILIRPGFKVLEFREDYHNEPDTEHVNPLFDKLFARGPGFALIQAPDGTKFWVGTNHEKSKSGNSVEVTKWRNAEGRRVNQIINELSEKGPKAVFFLGDMNDELGYQEYEQEAGGSGTDLIAGKGKGELTVLTRKLAESGAISFGGYRSTRYESFIDHAFATPEAAKWVTNVNVFKGDLADVASDHYPVYVDVNVP